MGLNFCRWDRSKDELLASRQNRRRNFVPLRCGHDEHNVRGRLLENFEKRVESGCGEHVNFIDDEDLVAASRCRILCALSQFADVIDAGVGCRVNLENIDRLS